MVITNSVLIDVNQNTEGIIVLIMKKEFVNFVESSSQQISIAKQNVVQGHAQIETEFVKIKSIKQCESEPVYNMEVENHHNFAVNGGFLVHNCMDAMRYSIEKIIKGDVFSFD